MTTQYQQVLAEVDTLIHRLRTYRNPNPVRSHIAELLNNNPSMLPRSGTLVQNGPQIICLVGTLPVFYKQNTYNIPIHIWIRENYPVDAPVVYVTPTQDMVISPKHKHVDTRGIVYLPYLSSWSPNSCTLSSLASIMSQVFSEDPPVRARSSQSQPQPQPQGQGQAQSQTQNNQYKNSYGSLNNPPQNNFGSQTNLGNSQTSLNTSQGNFSNQQGQGFNQSQSSFNNSGPIPTNWRNSGNQYPNYGSSNGVEQARQNAISNVTAKIRQSLERRNQTTIQTIEDNMRRQNEAETRLRLIEQEIQRMTQMKEQIENDSEQYLLNTSRITQWLEQYNTGQFDIDMQTQPKEALSNQLLNLVAEDATIEDTLYYLEKGLGKGKISLDEFMKVYRDLAHRQFICRATIKKVHERQRGG